MDIIKFNDGFKTFALDKEETKVIQFNPSDFGILTRFKNSKSAIDEITNNYSKLQADNESENAEVLEKCDADMRNLINYIMGNDVCTVAFGTVNCCSLAGGQPVAYNFLEAIIPVVESAVKSEQKASSERVKKYTSQKPKK